MSEEKCETCRFHLAIEDAGGGLCRRWPPQVVVTRPQSAGDQPDYGHANMWPLTRAEWWCGEYSPKVTH